MNWMCYQCRCGWRSEAARYRPRRIEDQLAIHMRQCTTARQYRPIWIDPYEELEANRQQSERLVKERLELRDRGARLWQFAADLLHKHDNLKALAEWRLKQLNDNG